MAAYTLERNGRQCRVKLQGDLTAHLVPELQPVLKQEIEQGAVEIDFDLRSTEMLDSSGIGLLIAARNSLAAKGGRLRVLDVSSEIMRLLQNMRLVSRLNVSGR